MAEHKSFVLLEDWWIRKELADIATLAALRLYLVLRTYRNHKTGKCVVGTAKLMKQAKLLRRSITRAIDELSKLCLIEVNQLRHSKEQKYASNEYTVFDHASLA